MIHQFPSYGNSKKSNKDKNIPPISGNERFGAFPAEKALPEWIFLDEPRPFVLQMV